MPGQRVPFILRLADFSRYLKESRRVFAAQALSAGGLLLAAAALILVVTMSFRSPEMNPEAAGKVTEPTDGSVRMNEEVSTNLEPSIIQKTSAKEEVNDTKPRLNNRDKPSLSFGWQLDAVGGEWRYHPGSDFMRAENSDVVSDIEGKVVDIIKDRKYGLTVVIERGSYRISYASLGQALTHIGNGVRLGERIGTVGRAPSEPEAHVHISMQKAGVYLDPLE